MSDKLFDITGKRVWVAGHTGMVGSALVRRLQREDCTILTADRTEINLLSLTGVYRWVAANKPDLILVAAGRVGGIQANAAQPVAFYNENTDIGSNIVNVAGLLKVSKLVYLGAPCIYPRDCTQPMREDDLMSGPLEPTNEAYAMAKLSTMALARFYRQQEGHDFINVIPTNLYGPGDSVDPTKTHVVPALIMKILQAKQDGGEIKIWGTGKPVRELMHVDDAADGILFAAENWSHQNPINIAGGETVSIKQLFEALAVVMDFSGGVSFEYANSDGMPRKQLDGRAMTVLGWKPRIALHNGLRETYEWIKRELERRKNVEG